VLCCFKKAEDGHHSVYHVHTVGSGELRCVGEPPGPWASGDLAMAVSMMGFLDPPVLADGRIYWHPLKLPGGNAGNGKGKVSKHAGVRHHVRVLPASAVARGWPLP
jgi:hypothetical protein